jgi:hypothetical protein
MSSEVKTRIHTLPPKANISWNIILISDKIYDRNSDRNNINICKRQDDKTSKY